MVRAVGIVDVAVPALELRVDRVAGLRRRRFTQKSGVSPLVTESARRCHPVVVPWNQPAYPLRTRHRLRATPENHRQDRSGGGSLRHGPRTTLVVTSVHPDNRDRKLRSMKDKIATLCMADSGADAHSWSVPGCYLCGHSHQERVPWLRLTCQAMVLGKRSGNQELTFCGCRGVEIHEQGGAAPQR
jgi:hypothetical protein